MELETGTLASGSKGNSIFIRKGRDCIICDQGLSVKEFLTRAKGVGIERVFAIIITHEHTDHIKGVEALSQSYNIPVFVHEKAFKSFMERVADRKRLKVRTFGDSPFYFRDFKITPFRIPHDTVYPVGFTVEDGKEKTAVATDLGKVTEGVLENLKGCDLAVIETNHDIELLKSGVKYPEKLKERILSDFGHLSNESGAGLAAELIKQGTKAVMFAHLSEENNTEIHVRSAYGKIFEENKIKEDDAEIQIALQKKPCNFRRIYGKRQ